MRGSLSSSEFGSVKRSIARIYKTFLVHYKEIIEIKLKKNQELITTSWFQNWMLILIFIKIRK